MSKLQDYVAFTIGLFVLFFILILFDGSPGRQDQCTARNIELRHKDEHEERIFKRLQKTPVIDWLFSDGIFYKYLKAGDSLVIVDDDRKVNTFKADKNGYCRIVSNSSAQYIHGILYVHGSYCWGDSMY